PPVSSFFPYTTLFRSLMILSSIVSTAVVYDGFDWQIGTFSDHLYRPLAYAVPLGILIAVYKWRAEKEGKQRTHNYSIEKLGATLDRKSTRLNSSHVSI